MTVACYPLDAVAGAPEYTGRMLRDTLAALIGGASAARPLGGFSGVRPGTASTTVALSGLDWTCEPHAGVLDVQAAAEAGPYLYAVMTDETGTLDAQAVGNARSDLLVAQLSDPAEADGTSVPEVEIVYVPGTAGPGAPDPATPARSMVLARFNVPQSGGGSPTVTWLAPALYAAGARPSVATIAALATLEEYTNMEATVESTPGAFWKYNGSAWKMHGTPRFANAAARDAAITAPTVDMRCVLTSDELTYQYVGSTWMIVLSPERHQADTTNSVRGVLVQSGIGKISGAVSTDINEAVTFPVAYSGIPVVVANMMGQKTAGAYNPTGLSPTSSLLATAMLPSTTGFTAYIRQTTGGNLTTANDYYYSWVARGVPA